MNESKFKIGDIVVYISGGPDMAVIDVSDSQWIVCEWFDGTTVKEKEFRYEVLKLKEEVK